MNHTYKWSRRIKEKVIRIINFCNKTEQQLIRTIAALKTRYSKVQVYRKLKGMLYTGYLEVTVK